MQNRFLTALVLAGGLALSVGIAAQAQQPANTGKPTTAPATATQPTTTDKKMDKKDEKTEQKGVKVGDTAPAFTLTDTDGKTVKLEDFKGKTVMLFWFNPACPGITMHFTKDTMTFNKLYEEYHSKGVEFVAINSGAAGKEGASKEENVKAKTDWKVQFPIALDPTGDTGHAYGATNTPHVFIINKDGKIAYKGAIDNGNFGKGTVGDKNYAKLALDNILAGKAADPATTKPYGCSIKFAQK
jgi:peroxiredoxin